MAARTQLHFNLHTRWWSVTPPGSGVVTASRVYGRDVMVKHPTSGAFKKCHAGTGPRKVFAWFKCTTVEMESTRPRPASAERIRFDPTKGDTHFHVVRDGQKVVVNHLSECWAEDDSNGPREMWGIVS